MNFDNDLVVGKLRRWEKFLAAYRLPEWDAIPDFGLYMEQVVQLLKQYLDYLPPELRQTEPITAAPSTTTCARSSCRSRAKSAITASISRISS